MCVLLFCTFVFHFVYSVFLYCFVYCFSFCIYDSLFPVFAQFCRLVPPGGNPPVVNKYHYEHLLMACAGTAYFNLSSPELFF